MQAVESSSIYPWKHTSSGVCVCVCVVVVIVARLQVADPPSNSTRIQVAYSCREKPEFVVLESVNVSAEEAISGLGWSNGWAQFCY